ncbi:hypothetical protein [Streptomyces sp. MNP-20]|uniref:hypothetical protein n=1 Tax=Streptomyces sp. MNP-20 TaxID=2721165 RepID=UPI00155628E6|nr:hypothetical protein [Streptomyces sp. MNP-20]
MDRRQATTDQPGTVAEMSSQLTQPASSTSTTSPATVHLTSSRERRCDFPALVTWSSASPINGSTPPGCTITGTAGDDNLTDTAGDDTVCGLGGNGDDTCTTDPGDTTTGC